MTIDTLIKKRLKGVPTFTLWGAAISEALKVDDDAKFKTLIAQLTSQAKDNPELMVKILGFDLPLCLSMEGREGDWFRLSFKKGWAEFVYNGLNMGGDFVFVNDQAIKRVPLCSLHTTII